MESSYIEGRLSFNISNSNGLALFAIAYDRFIGIDIERIRPLPDVDQLAKYFISHREYAVISSLPPEQKLKTFFGIWTLKATGEGLEGLGKVEINFAPGGATGILSIQADTHANCLWSACVLNLQSGYASALVVQNISFTIGLLK